MKYECVGVSFKKGQFTNHDTGLLIDYNNVIFNCIYDSIDKYTIGKSMLSVKIKRSLLDYDDNEIKQFIGRKVTFDVVPSGKDFIFVGINLAD